MKFSTYSVKSSISTPYSLFNYYFKYISDHLYKEKSNKFSKYKIDSNLNVHSRHKKFIKSFDPNIYNNYVLAASSHPNTLYKFIDSSYSFRDKYFRYRSCHSRGFLEQCKIYYSRMLYYQRMFIYYNNKFLQSKNCLIYSKDKLLMYKNYLRHLSIVYRMKKDKNIFYFIKLCYFKYNLFNKLYLNSYNSYSKFSLYYSKFKEIMINNFEGLNVKNKWFLGENLRKSLKKSYYRHLFKRKLDNIVKLEFINRSNGSNIEKSSVKNII